jgi:hypothetical protein
MVHNPNSSNSNKNYDIDCCKEYKECYGVTKQECDWTKCSVCESDCVKTAQFSLKPASIVGATAILSILKNLRNTQKLRSLIVTYNVKGKAIPLQAWTGPEGCRRLRQPDFKTIGT